VVVYFLGSTLLYPITQRVWPFFWFFLSTFLKGLTFLENVYIMSQYSCRFPQTTSTTRVGELG